MTTTNNEKLSTQLAEAKSLIMKKGDFSKHLVDEYFNCITKLPNNNKNFDVNKEIETFLKDFESKDYKRNIVICLALATCFENSINFLLNKKIEIISGYRSATKQQIVNKKSPNSLHKSALAIDIAFVGVSGAELNKALATGFLYLDAIDKTRTVYEFIKNNINNLNEFNLNFLKNKYILELVLYIKNNHLHIGINTEPKNNLDRSLL